MAHIGEALEQARIEAGISNRELCRRANIVDATWVRYRDGVSVPPPSVVDALARACGVSDEWLAMHADRPKRQWLVTPLQTRSRSKTAKTGS